MHTNFAITSQKNNSIQISSVQIRITFERGLSWSNLINSMACLDRAKTTPKQPLTISWPNIRPTQSVFRIPTGVMLEAVGDGLCTSKKSSVFSEEGLGALLFHIFHGIMTLGSLRCLTLCAGGGIRPSWDCWTILFQFRRRKRRGVFNAERHRRLS